MNIPGPSLILKAKECSPLCWLQCDSVPGNKASLCLATARLLSPSPGAQTLRLVAMKSALGYNVTEPRDDNEIAFGYNITVF